MARNYTREGGALETVTTIFRSQSALLNTVFDMYVSFTFFSKTLEPLVTKSGSQQVDNINFSFLESSWRMWRLQRQ